MAVEWLGGMVAFGEPRVAYVEADGVIREQALPVCRVDFASAAPVRSFPSYRGQRNFPGHYYAACTGVLVGFESWLERDEAMAMDFDPQIVAFAAQPFRLTWAEGRVSRSHVPDFFARCQGGAGVVVDCRPLDRIGQRDRELFEGTAQVCAENGWEFRLVGGHDPVWLGNVRWLAGYRHPRYRIKGVAVRLLEVFAEPVPLVEGAGMVGEPIAVLPVLYHLMWAHDLRTDLTRRLDGSTLVARR